MESTSPLASIWSENEEPFGNSIVRLSPSSATAWLEARSEARAGSFFRRLSWTCFHMRWRLAVSCTGAVGAAACGRA